MQPRAKTNVAGKPLRWCLYMGCDDYLAHSVYGLAAYLEIIGSPFSLSSYDGEHKAPTNWMTALDQCLGISATDTVTVKDGYDVTCKEDSQFVLKGSQQGGGGGQRGGGGAARQCTEVLTRFCCGDGLCDGPEHEDNCAADCGGDNSTPSPDTTSRPTPTVTTTPSTTVNTCNPWCSRNNHPQKCTWNGCKGCQECGTVPTAMPPMGRCMPWCSRNAHPRKCQWRACSGCDDCNNRRLQSNFDLVIV